MYCAPATTTPAVGSASPWTLAVTVLFTDVPHTLAALRHAGRLSGSLHASLRILVPVVVPYPLDLTESTVNQRYLCRRIRTIADGVGIPTRIEMVHCRDRQDAVEKALDPNSILVVCWRKRWWPFDRTARLAERLSRLGHQIVDVRSK